MDEPTFCSHVLICSNTNNNATNNQIIENNKYEIGASFFFQ